MIKQNETNSYDYWLPPQIPSNSIKALKTFELILQHLYLFAVSSSNLKETRPIIVKEGDNLRLQCAATGVPLPSVVWEREDGKAIDWGNWKDNSKVGHSINITKINRVHMGNYICIADNAIPPVAKYMFRVEVNCELIENNSFVYIRRSLL